MSKLTKLELRAPPPPTPFAQNEVKTITSMRLGLNFQNKKRHIKSWKDQIITTFTTVILLKSFQSYKEKDIANCLRFLSLYIILYSPPYPWQVYHCHGKEDKMAAATWIARATFLRARGKLSQLRTLPNAFRALRVSLPSFLLRVPGKRQTLDH